GHPSGGAVRRRPGAVRAHPARQHPRPPDRQTQRQPQLSRPDGPCRRRGRRRADGGRGGGRMSVAAQQPGVLARFAPSAARRRRDRLARWIVMAATVLALIPLVLILYYLLHKGLGAWSPNFFTSDPTGNTFFGGSKIGGIKSAILGTIEMVALAGA